MVDPYPPKMHGVFFGVLLFDMMTDIGVYFFVIMNKKEIGIGGEVSIIRETPTHMI
jgi:hypothetical protein